MRSCGHGRYNPYRWGNEIPISSGTKWRDSTPMGSAPMSSCYRHIPARVQADLLAMDTKYTTMVYPEHSQQYKFEYSTELT